MIANETITEDETNKLLKAAAARDQRTIGAADILAWYQDLNVAGIRYADASEAVARYYAIHWPRQAPNHRFRLTSPMLIELVHEIRNARHDAANFVYEPVDGETGAESAARLKAQQRAVGDGHPAPSGLAQLAARPVRELEGRLSSTWSLPPEISEVLQRARPAGSAIPCPRCHAKPNHKCCDPATGRQMRRLHDSRIAAWAVLGAPCPDCRALIGDGCRELGEPYRDNAHPARIDAAKRVLNPNYQEA